MLGGVSLAVAGAMALLPAPVAPAPATEAGTGVVRAGVAKVDASWRVGASAGQYASDGTFIGNHGVDPGRHSTRRAASYGVQSRLQARALVVEGPDGKRVAIVKNDLYIPQDLLFRRTAQILEQRGTSGIGRATLTMAASHNHSSPMYSSSSWGVWAFQDVIDVRFFEYYAQRQAEAVERAAAALVPVRVGASVSRFDKTARHSFGPQVADDGTPAGYPVDDIDDDLTVIRFDDVSDPARPKPLANLVNFSLHPEFLNGNDLISGDYIAPLERMVDRGSGGAMTIFTQNAPGTAEPERSAYHPVRERLEFTHREYGQAEYGARLMADAVLDTAQDVARATPEDESRFVGFATRFPVKMEDRWFPGPVSHPYPGVSNCRTDTALGGNPQAPVVGLPDCQGPRALAPPLPIEPIVSTDDLQRAGIPVPENYGAPAYTGLEESVDVHLQAIRLGDILLTVCPCEQWRDQSENIETRTDRVAGNEYVGYDWKARCEPNRDGTYGGGEDGYGTGTWACPDPRRPGTSLPPLSDQKVQRMGAQVTNPANGWNDVDYAPYAESEPTDVREIKGNFTHDDDAESARLGYKLTVPISMANDYNGYIATYREFQRGDHYRKALTGWGPHSADYLATRLVNLGRVLNGGDEEALLPPEPGDAKIPADLAVNDARAAALGAAGGRLAELYESRLPDDGGTAGALVQPRSIERFAATSFTFVGGSNSTDNPLVEVQRRVDGAWRPFAAQAGEIPVTLRFPQGEEVASYLQGAQRWEWTAHFEAFAASFDTVEGVRATPAGTYRFVVDGRRRAGGRVVPYHLESDPFEVAPWRGITVEDLRVEPDGNASFRVGPRRQIAVQAPGGPTVSDEIGPIDYPDSYATPVRFIDDERTPIFDPDAPADPSRIEWFCFACSFRPWADAGNAAQARVTIVDASGAARTVPATEAPDGRWRTAATLADGESASVAAGDVTDAFGNVNGAASARVAR